MANLAQNVTKNAQNDLLTKSNILEEMSDIKRYFFKGGGEVF